MRLQKQLSKKIGNVEYPKYVIVIKPSIIDKLGWKEGQMLESVIKGEKLLIKKDKEPKKE
ncbi:hypothetical protein J4434_08385 [Candidatus Woesearchaeota archaeon]|nr:hypothetical protein [Candidatus Woesearchaeota archaeon]